ncbi:hypothetical protein ACJRO7_015859 [Eucalyptus globulus]|uniref:Uncharacterized protein n=1 Tax=Eucalyptus globulus TaxID=34317 RepID=A0ABD3L554_EUCGL
MATERYLAAIKAHTNMQPKLEEGNLKMLHIKEPAWDWQEWMIMTEIDHYEMKLKFLTSPLPPTYDGWPTFNTSMPGSQIVGLDIVTSSKENEH